MPKPMELLTNLPVLIGFICSEKHIIGGVSQVSVDTSQDQLIIDGNVIFCFCHCRFCLCFIYLFFYLFSTWLSWNLSYEAEEMNPAMCRLLPGAQT